MSAASVAALETLRLTADPVVAASHCKNNYLHAQKTDCRVNWGGLWGDSDDGSECAAFNP